LGFGILRWSSGVLELWREKKDIFVVGCCNSTSSVILKETSLGLETLSVLKTIPFI
jgi:hypothetical protein